MEEQCNELKVQSSLLESKDTKIEQLHRQLEHTLSNNSVITNDKATPLLTFLVFGPSLRLKDWESLKGVALSFP